MVQADLLDFGVQRYRHCFTGPTVPLADIEIITWYGRLQLANITGYGELLLVP